MKKASREEDRGEMGTKMKTERFGGEQLTGREGEESRNVRTMRELQCNNPRMYKVTQTYLTTALI